MGQNTSQELDRAARKIQIRELRSQKQNSLYSVAKIIGLSSPTAIYPLVKEIAVEDGVTYESLLDQPHQGYNREAPYVSRTLKTYANKSKVESISESPFDELLAELQRMYADCENMLTVLTNIDAMKGE